MEIKLRREQTLPRPLKIFLYLSIGLTLFCWIEALLAHMMGMPKPYSWPYYYVYLDRFGDYVGYYDRFKVFRTPDFWAPHWLPFPYPTPVAVCFKFLFGIWGNLPHPRLSYLFFTIFFFIVGAIMLWREITKRGITGRAGSDFIILAVFFSYPFYFILQRSNIEIFVWIVLGLATVTMNQRKWTLMAILVGIAVALKWYPIFFCGIFFRKGRYHQIAVVLGTALTATVLSAAYVGPTVSYALKQAPLGMQYFMQIIGLRYWELGYDHSFVAAIKIAVQPHRPDLQILIHRYLEIAALLGTALYFLRIRKLPVLNQFFILMILAVTLPPVSFDYTLLELYFAWGLYLLYLLDARNQGKALPLASWIMALYALIFTPESYVILHGVRYGAQVRLICLCGLLLIFLRYPMPSHMDESTERSHISNS